MRIVSLFIILLSCWNLSAIAGSETRSVENKETENNIDEALERILPDNCIFSGEFNQVKQLDKLPVPLSSSGQLLFSCHHGLIWKSIKPFNEDLIYTLKSTHFRVIENNEPIPLEGLQHHYLAKFLLSLLSANIESIQRDFDISLDQSNRDTVAINLLPTNTYAKKGLDSISIKKTVAETGDELSINIIDSKKQKTKINIVNINNAKNDSKDEMNLFCHTIFSQAESTCSILSSPQQYIDIKPSN